MISAATESDFEARLLALEAYEQIRQLAARYALALDSRNIDDVVALFVEDVRTADGGRGRQALTEWFDSVLRPFTTTFHLIGNHVIDLADADHATGIVYCRPEHEVGDLWIVMPLQYWDRYERRDGTFPGNPMLDRADLPERWESWQRFWADGQPPTDRGAS
jgi:hypothetical protein